MLMTQSGSSSSDDSDDSETIQRTPKSDMAKPIEYEIDIERFQEPKKTQMLIKMARKQVFSTEISGQNGCVRESCEAS
ncbi:hypothetical protein DPMN_063266 [Dreissena polymorpha]|uniref:Uncharacterized protein n=1 Tax=Dreissena polymorpha TaxID=45954 RepID=A0A9D4CB17_DREPO|nr:hypothetical protein DPMN_063266 [Dreissena polymorpha]